LHFELTCKLLIYNIFFLETQLLMKILQEEFPGFSVDDIDQASCRVEEFEMKPSYTALMKQQEHRNSHDMNYGNIENEMLIFSTNSPKSIEQRTSEEVMRKLSHEFVAPRFQSKCPSNECVQNKELYNVGCTAVTNAVPCDQCHVVCQNDDGIHTETSVLDSTTTTTMKQMKSKVVRKDVAQTLKSKVNSNYFSKFCLPSRSVHSKRIITPNKRFLDVYDCLSERKKPKLLPDDVSATASPAVHQSLPKSGDTSELKADAADNLQVVSSVSDLEELALATTSTVSIAREKFCDAKLPLCGISQSDKTQAEKSAVTEQIKNVNNSETRYPPSSIGSILHKPKLQLNQAAINRSKAALARSLKRQMAMEEQLELESSLGNDYSAPASAFAETIRNAMHFKPAETCLTAADDSLSISVKFSGMRFT
jgi:hypothetical protein